MRNLLPRGLHLNRRGKLVRNLALAAALLAAFWLGTERSTWNTDGALRQMEAALLLPPGETLYRQKGGEFGREDWVFVLGDTYAYTGVVRSRDLGRSLYGRNAAIYESLVLDQAPGLLSLSSWDLLGGTQEVWTVFCPNGPEGAETAQLTIAVSCLWTREDGREEVQTLRLSSSSQRDAHGVFSFSLPAEAKEEEMLLCTLMGGHGYEANPEGRPVRRCEVTGIDGLLTFFSAGGTTVEQVSGELFQHGIGTSGGTDC